MKQILLTGGSGFIARHFHEALKDQNITNFDKAVPMYPQLSKHILGDVRKLEDFEKVFQGSQFDLILHLAAAHQDFGISQKEYFDTNELGAKHLTDLASKYGVHKIVFYSSVAVYGDQLNPTTEETLPNPSNYYGASKLAGEQVFLAWIRADPKNELLIIRPAVVYGEWNFANMYRLIEQVFKRRFFFFGEGRNIKSIAYVKNLVDATLFLIDRMKPGVQLFNYADHPELTSREIVKSILKSLPRP